MLNRYVWTRHLSDTVHRRQSLLTTESLPGDPRFPGRFQTIVLSRQRRGVGSSIQWIRRTVSERVEVVDKDSEVQVLRGKKEFLFEYPFFYIS